MTCDEASALAEEVHVVPKEDENRTPRTDTDVAADGDQAH